MTVSLTPRQIVSELDKHIVGQNAAKKAVAVAIRNRWRRQQLPEDLRKDVTPKNIILIGPTGVGKTEIARRLAQLVGGAVREGRGHEVHGSGLRRPRCGEYGPRSRGGGHRSGAAAAEGTSEDQSGGACAGTSARFTGSTGQNQPLGSGHGEGGAGKASADTGEVPG